MEFEDYRVKATVTACYPNCGENIIYPVLGLNGEAGEVAEKFKKLWRKTGYMSIKDYHLTEEEKTGLKKELGDVMWYIAAICTEAGFNMDEVAAMNIKKLLDRRERGVINGEGDNR